MFTMTLSVLSSIILAGVSYLWFIKAFFKLPPEQHGLIVYSKCSKPKLHFSGALVYPLINKTELVKLSVVEFSVSCQGKDRILCKDNRYFDTTCHFAIRMNQNHDDLLSIINRWDIENINSPQAVKHLFHERFYRAIQHICSMSRLEDILRHSPDFERNLLNCVGRFCSGEQMNKSSDCYWVIDGYDVLSANFDYIKLIDNSSSKEPDPLFLSNKLNADFDYNSPQHVF